MYYILDIRAAFDKFYGGGVSFLQPEIIRYGKIGHFGYELSFMNDLYIVTILKDIHLSPKQAPELGKSFSGIKDAEKYIKALERQYGRNKRVKKRGFFLQEFLLNLKKFAEGRYEIFKSILQ